MNKKLEEFQKKAKTELDNFREIRKGKIFLYRQVNLEIISKIIILKK